MKARLEVVCDDVFTADLPIGEARLVYADPPYMQSDLHGYGAAPDPRRLIERMVELGADDAAYVLHCGQYQLLDLLPLVEELAPPRPRYYDGQKKGRVLSWVKPWVRTSIARERNRSWRAMWEPIVVFHGRGWRNSWDLTEADWVCAVRDERSAGRHPTQKPDEVLRWLFDRMLAGAAGRLAIDLFAGTGGAALMAAKSYGCDAIAVERNPAFAATIVERAATYTRTPSQVHTVAVTTNGRPLWSTLGRDAA